MVISLFVRWPPALQPITTSRSGSAMPCLIERVDAGQHVEVHVLEIAADDVAIEGVAVAGAAAIVRAQHGVALRRQHRKVVEQQAGPGAELVRLLRPAVHLHDQRIPPAGRVVDRIEQQPFDRRAVGALPRDLSCRGSAKSRSSASKTPVTRTGRRPALRRRESAASTRRRTASARRTGTPSGRPTARRSTSAGCSASPSVSCFHGRVATSIWKISLCTPMLATARIDAPSGAHAPDRSRTENPGSSSRGVPPLAGMTNRFEL